jgi:hypothetical protein
MAAAEMRRRVALATAEISFAAKTATTKMASFDIPIAAETATAVTAIATTSGVATTATVATTSVAAATTSSERRAGQRGPKNQSDNRDA